MGEPLAKEIVEGRVLSFRPPAPALDERFVRTQGDVLHKSSVHESCARNKSTIVFLLFPRRPLTAKRSAAASPGLCSDRGPLSVLLLFLAVGVLAPLLPAAEPWSRFRGSSGSGVLDVQNLPDSFDPGKNQLWSVKSPRGKSSPVIAGDRVFLTGWRGNLLLVLCFDRWNGIPLWERSITKAHKQTMSGLNDAAAPTIAADSTGVYAFFSESGLFGFNAADGKPRWNVPLGPFNSVHGVGTSPVAPGGYVLLAIEQQVGGSWFAAFDAATGARKWQTDFEATGQQGYSTPALIAPSGQEIQVILSRPGEVGAWSLETVRQWRRPFGRR